MSGESHRFLTVILYKSIATHLPFASLCFGRVIPSYWLKAMHARSMPVCATMPLPLVSYHVCRSNRSGLLEPSQCSWQFEANSRSSGQQIEWAPCDLLCVGAAKLLKFFLDPFKPRIHAQQVTKAMIDIASAILGVVYVGCSLRFWQFVHHSL